MNWSKIRWNICTISKHTHTHTHLSFALAHFCWWCCFLCLWHQVAFILSIHITMCIGTVHWYNQLHFLHSCFFDIESVFSPSINPGLYYKTLLTKNNNTVKTYWTLCNIEFFIGVPQNSFNVFGFTYMVLAWWLGPI